MDYACRPHEGGKGPGGRPQAVTLRAKNQVPSRCLYYFRPISAVPILSRILERIVVTNYIYPAISAPSMVNLVADQFAFRPTSSTTAALIDLLHNITVLLYNRTNLSIYGIYIAPLQGNYSEALPAQARAKIKVLTSL